LEAALMIDSVDVLTRGLTTAITQSQDVFRNSFRRGQFVYYDQTRGMQCRDEQITSWNHGHTILNHLRRIRFRGLTGPIAFDLATGHRTKFHLDIMSLSFDSELKQVSNLHCKQLIITQKIQSGCLRALRLGKITGAG